MTAEAAARISSAYLTETQRKEKLSKVLKNCPPSTKEFEAILIAWTQLVEIKSEEDAFVQAMLYETEIRPSWV